MIGATSRQLPAAMEIERGARERLEKATDPNVKLFEEYLDQPNFSGPAYEETMESFLRGKFAVRSPEAVIVVGRSALQFMLRRRARLFPGVPVVHVSVEESFLKSAPPLPTDVIGVPLRYDPTDTLELLARLHPNMRRLLVVTGTSDQDRVYEAETSAAVARLARFAHVDFLAGLSHEAVLERLRGLESGDVVFVAGYYRDGKGRVFLPADVVAKLAAESAAPVYWPFRFVAGTVGGSTTNYVEMGRQAGDLVRALLDGVPPAKIRVPAVVPQQLQVDWRQVQRWGISPGDIPEDAAIQFREPSFWQAYRDTAIVVAAVILLQAALIAALLIERRQRRRTASALAESETRMNLAARAAGLSVWLWQVARDGTRKVTTGRAHGVAPKEAPIGLDLVLESVHPADRTSLESAVRDAAMANQDLDVEYRLLQPGGDVRWVAVRGRAATGTEDCMMGVAMDITARKLSELQAEKDRAALTHMTRVSTMGQLSASIAHQLNQPLAAILGNSEVARKMLEHEPLDLNELREICDDIITEDKRAAEVIARLGALFRRGEVTFAALDLNELVSETLDILHSELLTRHVTAVTELAPGLPPVDGGRVQLQQVLLNLILNAADAMSQTESERRRVVVRTELDGGNVRLCVTDNGTGIAPADIDSVFEAFWSTKSAGTGVGLAICRSIVMAHGGTLSVSNNAAGGATFCARWPIRQPS